MSAKQLSKISKRELLGIMLQKSTKQVSGKSNNRRREAIRRNVTLATLTLVGVGLLQLAFASAYLVAFHSPRVHELPIAIVGKESETKPLAKNLQQKDDGAYKVSQFTDYSQAEDKMKNQKLFAIYQPEVPKSTITVASANGEGLAKDIPGTLTKLDEAFQAEAREEAAAQPPEVLEADPAVAELAEAPISSPTVKDIAPLPEGDSEGVALFYTAFSLVFGGYLAAVALNMVRGSRKFTREAVFVRTASLAVFSVLTSMLIALIATHGVSAMPDEYYWPIVGIGTLTTFGVSMLASAIVSFAGVFGTALVILLFVIIGTPASGGPMPVAITGNGPWHALTAVLPTGPALDAIRQVVYFNGLNVMHHLLTPIAYAVVGFIGLFLYGFRRSSVSPYDNEIAQDVAEDKKQG